MSDITIYHNPRCSKSRQALALIEEAGHKPEIILYLKDPLAVETLRQLVKRLGVSCKDILRKNEADYKAHFGAIDSMDVDEILRLMVAHPIVIERPLIIRGDRAVIGRPPEAVTSLL